MILQTSIMRHNDTATQRHSLSLSQKFLRLIKQCIKWPIRQLFRLIPSGKVILFESHPDFSCNTYPVYLKLRELLPDYKMVWMLHGHENKDADDIIPLSSIAGKIKKLYYLGKCRAIVQCNSYVQKLKASQLSIYLEHGVPLKNVTGMYDMAKSKIDFHNMISPFFDKILLKEINGTQDKLVHLGYPRCDYFFAAPRTQEISEIVSGKYIIWLPTFRRHKSKTRDDAPDSPFNNIGIPLFYDIESLKSFDEFLGQHNISILYKPHPASDLDVLKKAELKNFRIIYDADILGRNLQLYEVIAQSEALITDYSSIFWEYMLLDRPIAITTDDIEEYRSGLSFIMDIESVYRETAEIVPDGKIMRSFVLNVLEGRDIMREGRRKWRDIANLHQDGKSTQRVAEFIAQKLNAQNSSLI